VSDRLAAALSLDFLFDLPLPPDLPASQRYYEQQQQQQQQRPRVHRLEDDESLLSGTCDSQSLQAELNALRRVFTTEQRGCQEAYKDYMRSLDSLFIKHSRFRTIGRREVGEVQGRMRSLFHPLEARLRSRTLQLISTYKREAEWDGSRCSPLLASEPQELQQHFDRHQSAPHQAMRLQDQQPHDRRHHQPQQGHGQRRRQQQQQQHRAKYGQVNNDTSMHLDQKSRRFDQKALDILNDFFLHNQDRTHASADEMRQLMHATGKTQ
jgi:hypothetical protein